MANGPLQRQPSRLPATPTAPECLLMMEGDARCHRAAIGVVKSAAAAIIAAECTPPQESRWSSSAGLGHLGIVKLNFN